MSPAPIVREIRHFHFFCGLGGGAKGFNRGSARVGAMQARFRCIGGIDSDPAAIRDFERAAGVPGAVIAASTTGQGAFAVADPRTGWAADAHPSKLAIQEWEETARTVTGARVQSGALCVADPRPGYGSSTHRNILRVTEWEDTARTVTSGHHPAGGGLCVADPRPDFARDGRVAYVTGGHYGVVPWGGSSGSVTASGQHDNGRWSVADPRGGAGDDATELPAADARLVAVIQAEDGTWHRPFTTLELAALQSLIEPEEFLELDGLSDSAWRERIGNAVPPDAAQAVASEMGRTLLLAWTGQTFILSNAPIWVQQIAIALSVEGAAP